MLFKNYKRIVMVSASFFSLFAAQANTKESDQKPQVSEQEAKQEPNESLKKWLQGLKNPSRLEPIPTSKDGQKDKEKPIPVFIPNDASRLDTTQVDYVEPPMNKGLFVPVPYGVQGDNLEFPMPLTLEDISGCSKIELTMPFLRLDGLDYLSPTLTGRFWHGSWSLGMVLPINIVVPQKDGDNSVDLGNIAFDISGRKCIEGKWSYCIGGSMGASLGIDNVSNEKDAVGQLLGSIGHQSLFYNGSEALVVRPIAVLAVTNGNVFAQVEIGPEVFVPIKEYDPRDEEVVLAYNVCFGAQIADTVFPMVEFRGLSVLINDDADDLFWINLGARFKIKEFLPMFRLSFPLNRQAGSEVASTQFEIGVAMVY